MRRFSIPFSIICATALASATLGAPASAVTVQELGQNAPGEGPIGGCICTAAQFADSGSADYLIPGNGVLTKIRVWIGKKTEAGQTVQARTFHITGPTTANVASEGGVHSIEGLPTGQHFFYDRIPATAGDVLGASFHDSALIEDTPLRFPTASSGDIVGEASSPLNPSLGQPFTATAIPSWRVNMMAIYESDEDGDGYGDASQDLCPGSPIGATACSGTLFGSNLQGEGSTPPAPCGGGGCMKVQKTLNSASTAAAFNGVVVRWRVLNGETGNYRARVLVPNPGATGGLYTGFTVLHSSELGSVTAPAAPFSKISTFQTRLPIPAGGYVGLRVPSLAAQGFQASSGAATYVEPNDGGDGLTVSGQSHNGAILYDADIEPDVDGDGYGDVSQDSCPSSAAIHEGACPTLPPLPPPTPTARPQITGFKAVPKSFRVKLRGAVVSSGKAGPQGTKLQLTLTTAAKVAFTVESKLVCKLAKKTAHRCKLGFHKVHAFSRSLPRGASSLPYSGRYKRAGKVKNLKPGPYRVTAVPSNTAGTGTPVRTTFTVLR